MATQPSALKELIDLANEKGYQHWDTSDSDINLHSWTFGQENVFCLTVRFDRFWRVLNAIYVHFPTSSQDQYIPYTEKNKRDKIFWVLNFLPDDFSYWDGLFEKELVKR